MLDWADIALRLVTTAPRTPAHMPSVMYIRGGRDGGHYIGSRYKTELDRWPSGKLLV